ncbi:MAG: phage integrase family protein [Symploca sp. SIO2E9]|nr:phage integrase family protein [Symploca sp. SIO2E9]
MKINRHGKAKILSPEEIQLLFSKGLLLTRDRTLMAVMLYTAARVNETVTLLTTDVYNKRGKVRPELIIRKSNSKGKLATRSIPVLEDLRTRLENYRPTYDNGYLFPGLWGKGHLHRDSACLILKRACERTGLDGISTHSFRRTALTLMSNAHIPLRVIQEISGHRNLDQLQRYLEVETDQVKGAIAQLSMLSPTEERQIEKRMFIDQRPTQLKQRDST